MLFLQKGVACSRHWLGSAGGHDHGLPPPRGTDSPSEVTACLSLFPPDRNPVWIAAFPHGTERTDTTQIATHHDFRAHTPHPGLFLATAAKHSTKEAEKLHSGSGSSGSRSRQRPLDVCSHPLLPNQGGVGQTVQVRLRDAQSASITSFSRILPSYTRVPCTIYNRPFDTSVGYS